MIDQIKVFLAVVFVFTVSYMLVNYGGLFWWVVGGVLLLAGYFYAYSPLTLKSLVDKIRNMR